MSTTMTAPTANSAQQRAIPGWNTIVCGTDFSVHAQEAANVAAALARRTGAAVVLVHANDPAAAPHDPALFHDATARAEQQLANEARRLRHSGISIEPEFLNGAPAAALAQTVTRKQADLLIVSSIGSVSPRQFIVPSVAQGAAEHSSVPTLVIRHAAPIENWVKGTAPLKVFLAYDFSSTADNALEWIGRLRAIGPCEITVAYAPYPPQEGGRLGIGEHAFMDAVPPEMQRLLNGDLKERVGQFLDPVDVNLRIEPAWGRPDPVLLSLASEAGADLIVVGTHQRHGFGRFWLGSVSRGILRDAPCSVAVVPRVHATDSTAEKIPTVRRVLVTTDFSLVGNRAIPHAYSLLPAGGSVCLVHVQESARASGATKTDGSSIDHSSEAALQGLIPADAEARGIASVVEVIESSKPADAICQAAERFGADVLCIASHGRSGISKLLMGSIAQEVMERSSRPVLVVRVPAE